MCNITPTSYFGDHVINEALFLCFEMNVQGPKKLITLEYTFSLSIRVGKKFCIRIHASFFYGGFNICQG